MLSLSLSLLALLSLLASLIYRNNKLPSQFPPGPLNFPFLGAVHHLSHNLLESFLNLREKYGNVFGLKIGTSPTVVISDFETCVKVFKDANFSARPTYLTKMMGSVMHSSETDHPSYNRGVVFSSGNNWDTQRKFLLKKLSHFGVGKSALEDEVSAQVELFLKKMRADCKKGPLEMNEKFNISLVNAIWKIVTGSQFELDDPFIVKLYKGIDQFIESHRLIGVLMVFPWLSALMNHMAKHLKAGIKAMMRTIVDDHIKTFNHGYERDLVDAFIGKIQDTEDSTSSFFGLRGRTNLEQNMLELFGAGANPVASTLSFCILYLTRHQDIQHKILTEIKDNCNEDSAITMQNLKHLPFTNAFIHEVLRITSINFIGTPHMSIAPAQIGNYQVPAGTTVFAFLYFIMNDPSYWRNPSQLRPERFLDESGNFVKDERLIPYLVGRRQCLGLNLAQTEIFLFLTNLVREFQISEDPSSPLPLPTPTMGFVMGCPKYKVALEER